MRLMHVVPLLGMAQIVSWGTLYYTIGVLGKSMREALGVSEVFLFSAFTGSLLLSGVLAPAVGRMIDARGGRQVLSMGSLAGALAFVVLATASGPIALAIGWLIAGAAMAATLYDPAFATLNMLTREHYRRAVTALTLFGGFASTVFWPLTHFLQEPLGWRGTLLIYAALHLLICLPIHAFALRRGHQPMLNPPVETAAGTATKPADANRTLRWLAVSFAAGSFVISIVGVHMIALLTGSGLTGTQAVLVAMLMGPMQVAGRLVELGLLSHVRATRIGLGAFGLLFIGVVSLLATDGMGLAALLFVAAYGCGNGVLTIVRGTAPAELLGRDKLGALLGQLSRPAMFAKAVAPVAFTALLAAGFTLSIALAILAGVVAMACASFALAARGAGSKVVPVPHRESVRP